MPRRFLDTSNNSGTLLSWETNAQLISYRRRSLRRLVVYCSATGAPKLSLDDQWHQAGPQYDKMSSKGHLANLHQSELQIWDVAAGMQVHTIRRAVPACGYLLERPPDARMLAVFQDNLNIDCTSSWALLASMATPHGQCLTGMAWSSTCARLVYQYERDMRAVTPNYAQHYYDICMIDLS